MEALPGYVFPLADDVTVNCQVPLSGFEDEEDELLPQPAIQLHSNISTSIFFTTLLRSGIDNCGPCNAQTLQAIWECVQLLMVVTVATYKDLKSLPISKYLCLLRSRHASLDDQRRRRRVLGGARRASNRDGVGTSRGATSSAATPPLLPPPPQLTSDRQPPTSKNQRQQLSSFLGLGAAIPAVPNSMAGSTSHIAYSGLDRRSNGGSASAAVCAVVVMVRVLVTVLEFGVTEAGLKAQARKGGQPAAREADRTGKRALGRNRKC